MKEKLDLTGWRFGRLIAIRMTRVKNKKTYWLCECDCENIREVSLSNLRSGHTTSCGCWKMEAIIKAKRKHGMSKHRLHNIWSKIKRRCTRPNCKAYYRYGGRGIKVCDRWLESFENFIEDMYDKHQEAFAKNPKCQIDRIDNDGDYEPDNCRWVSSLENNRNRDNRGLKLRKLTDDQVREIRRKYELGGCTHKSLGLEYGVAWQTTGALINYRSYKEVK